MPSIFGTLSLDNILLLFRCVLAEKRILLLSTHLQQLVDIAELLTKVASALLWSRQHRARAYSPMFLSRLAQPSAFSRSRGRMCTFPACR